MNNFLVVVPVIIPSQPIEFSYGFKCFLLVAFFVGSIFFVIDSIIIFIRRFKK